MRLRDIGTYLQKVIDKELPVNHAILGNLQDVFNLLPNLSNPTASTPAELKGLRETEREERTELARAMSVKTNDQLMAIYLSSLIRAITAFHDLIENKIQNRQQEEEKEGKIEEEEKEKDNEVKKASKEANGIDGSNGEAKETEKDRKEKGKDGEKKR